MPQENEKSSVNIRNEDMQKLIRDVKAIAKNEFVIAKNEIVIAKKNERSQNDIIEKLDKIISVISSNVAQVSDIAEIQCKTIQKFSDEIEKFTKVTEQATENLKKASLEQAELLANVSGIVQGILTTGAKNIQNEFQKTHDDLQKIIQTSMNTIKTDYQDNMKGMFKAMAENLKSITDTLRNT